MSVQYIKIVTKEKMLISSPTIKLTISGSSTLDAVTSQFGVCVTRPTYWRTLKDCLVDVREDLEIKSSKKVMVVRFMEKN